MRKMRNKLRSLQKSYLVNFHPQDSPTHVALNPILTLLYKLNKYFFGL